MTNLEALKALHAQLGGTEEAVADATTTLEVLNAISAIYDGESGTQNANAIDEISKVASGGGGGGGKKTQTLYEGTLTLPDNNFFGPSLFESTKFEDWTITVDGITLAYNDDTRRQEAQAGGKTYVVDGERGSYWLEVTDANGNVSGDFAVKVTQPDNGYDVALQFSGNDIGSYKPIINFTAVDAETGERVLDTYTYKNYATKLLALSNTLMTAQYGDTGQSMYKYPSMSIDNPQAMQQRVVKETSNPNTYKTEVSFEAGEYYVTVTPTDGESS